MHAVDTLLILERFVEDEKIAFLLCSPWTHRLVVGGGYAARADAFLICIAARAATNESLFSFHLSSRKLSRVSSVSPFFMFYTNLYAGR
jgi:hypothetical protein